MPRMASAKFDLAVAVWMPMGSLFTWSLVLWVARKRRSSLKMDTLETWALRQTLLSSSGQWAVEWSETNYQR